MKRVRKTEYRNKGKTRRKSRKENTALANPEFID